jgi:Flp pilus assembly protein TadG
VRAAGALAALVREPDRGTVTAEFATLLPLVAMVLSLVVGGGTVGSAEIQCADAARAAARLAARGESDAVVLAAARQAAPPGAVVSLQPEAGGLVRVVVRVRVRLPVPTRPGVALTGSATAAQEGTTS